MTDRDVLLGDHNDSDDGFWVPFTAKNRRGKTSDFGSTFPPSLTIASIDDPKFFADPSDIVCACALCKKNHSWKVISRGTTQGSTALPFERNVESPKTDPVDGSTPPRSQSPIDPNFYRLFDRTLQIEDVYPQQVSIVQSPRAPSPSPLK